MNVTKFSRVSSEPSLWTGCPLVPHQGGAAFPPLGPPGSVPSQTAQTLQHLSFLSHPLLKITTILRAIYHLPEPNSSKKACYLIIQNGLFISKNTRRPNIQEVSLLRPSRQASMSSFLREAAL